jgi:RNA polymerase sigma-70 factor (ECF subfamily)
MEVSDSQILSIFKNSSTKEEGFKMLMVKYQQRLYWQIRRMVINHADADDVLQNVFIKVWKNLDKFEQQSQLFTWLYRITVNESLTFLNQKKRQNTDSLENENTNLAEQLTADRYFDGDEIQKKLQLAIDGLPNKQKQVFLMRYYDELSYEEMSEILGTSVGALKASYHFAVKKIESFLTED